jgi:hypothetical protein
MFSGEGSPSGIVFAIFGEICCNDQVKIAYEEIIQMMRNYVVYHLSLNKFLVDLVLELIILQVFQYLQVHNVVHKDIYIYSFVLPIAVDYDHYSMLSYPHHRTLGSTGVR